MADVVDELPAYQASPAVPEPGPLRRQPARNSRVKFLLLGAVLFLATAAGWAYFHFRDRVSSDDAQVDGHITAVAPKISGNVLEVLTRLRLRPTRCISA